ncbi:MAG: replication-associated recombination protein A [bacterium]
MDGENRNPDLFDASESVESSAEEAEDSPLAYRMRPRDFETFVGQDHAVGNGTPLRKALEADRLSSLIIHGPPGTGKTALAQIIARKTRANFERLNAVLCGVDDLRDVIDTAEEARRIKNKATILFFDEIHRFNKSQQDALLPAVEDGTLTLIGATTQNPYFYLNNALLSRSILVEFEALSEEELEEILDRALKDEEQGLSDQYELTETAREHLLEAAHGDGRRLLNGLEIAARTAESRTIELEQVEKSLQSEYIEYDRESDHHYDVASAYIKSIRGSDPDAAIYYLAKMLEAGEEPRFIARRLVIAASEDVGNANPRALQLAVSALKAVEFVGLPEAQIPLAQATTYLASSPKSNAAYKAVKDARQAIRDGTDLPVPDHLKDSHYQGAEERGHGVGYEYVHNHENHYVDQPYLSEDLTFYEPTEQGGEKKLKQYLESLRQKSGEDE